jgi:hypothetical protein
MSDDAEVLRRLVQGDRGAFESLFRRFETDVYRSVTRFATFAARYFAGARFSVSSI